MGKKNTRVEKIDTCYGKLPVVLESHEVAGWPYLHEDETSERIDVYTWNKKGERHTRASFYDSEHAKPYVHMFAEALAREIGAHQFGSSCSTLVSSSNIQTISCEEDDLIVTFKNGSVYLYVGAASHHGLIMRAASAGKYVNKNLVNNPEVKYICLYRAI